MARIRNPAAYAAAVLRRQEQELMQQQMMQQQQQMAMQQQQVEQAPEERVVEDDDNPLGAFQVIWGNRQPSREGESLSPRMKNKEGFISAFGDVFGGR